MHEIQVFFMMSANLLLLSVVAFVSFFVGFHGTNCVLDTFQAFRVVQRTILTLLVIIVPISILVLTFLYLINSNSVNAVYPAVSCFFFVIGLTVSLNRRSVL